MGMKSFAAAACMICTVASVHAQSNIFSAIKEITKAINVQDKNILDALDKIQKMLPPEKQMNFNSVL